MPLIFDNHRMFTVLLCKMWFQHRNCNNFKYSVVKWFVTFIPKSIYLILKISMIIPDKFRFPFSDIPVMFFQKRLLLHNKGFCQSQISVIDGPFPLLEDLHPVNLLNVKDQTPRIGELLLTRTAKKSAAIQSAFIRNMTWNVYLEFNHFYQDFMNKNRMVLLLSDRISLGTRTEKLEYYYLSLGFIYMYSKRSYLMQSHWDRDKEIQ